MKKFAKTYVFFSLFIVFSLWLRLFDVQALGPEGSRIGFAGLNVAIHEFFGMHLFWYKLTQVLGYVAILLAAAFALLGFIQLIKRKSLLKVDKNLLMLGVVYILLVLLYVLFEKIPFNYRPVILDPAEGLEPSYPSTHTLLILTVFGTAIQLAGNYIKNPKLLLAVRILAFIIMVLTIIGRLVCGVHWFTDIAGGILLSLSLISFYNELTHFTKKEE